MPNLGNTTRPAYVYDAETDTWIPVGVGAHSHDYTSQFIGKTLVDAKGDIVTASANDVPAILSKGADGTVLVADSTTSTGLAWQAPIEAGKNFVINGGMDFWQRGTTFAGSGNNYTADRWKFTQNGPTANAYTVTRQSSGLNGFQYCARFQRNVGDTNNGAMFIGYGMASEDLVPLQGKIVTMSFYARMGANFSGVSQNIGFSMPFGTGTGAHPFTGLTNEFGSVGATFTLTTSWQRFYFTATVPANATEMRFNIAHTPTGTAGAADYYEVTGFQLEAGSTPTSFSRYGRTYQGELAACQRYYVRMLSGTGSYTPFATGQVYNSTGAQIVVNHPVEMRIPPTSIEYASLGITNSGAGVVVPTSFSLSNPGKIISMLHTSSASGLVAGQSTLLVANATTAAYLAFNAEL
jgi:hypothetical protein